VERTSASSSASILARVVRLAEAAHLETLAAAAMRIPQPRPIDHVLRLPLDLDGLCSGLRAAAVALYPDDPDLGEELRVEAKLLEYLLSDRSCIETDHPSLPAADAPASAFVEWLAQVWQKESSLSHAIARADQLLGRSRLLACFQRTETLRPQRRG
jgi:hypothetical protein